MSEAVFVKGPEESGRELEARLKRAPIPLRKSGGTVAELWVFKPREVRAIVSFSRSLSIREAAAKSGLPRSTLWRLVKRLEEKGRFRVVLKLRAFHLYEVIAFEDKFEDPFAVAKRTLYRPGSRKVITTGLTPDPSNWDWCGEWVTWNPETAFRLGALTGDGAIRVSQALDAADEGFKEWLELGVGIKQRVPDPVDALLIHNFLLKTPPWRRYSLPPERLGEVGATVESLRAHWVRHVRPTWLYNTFTLYMDLYRVPMWFLVLSGSEASKLGIALAYLTPYAAAMIAPGKVFVILQIPAPGLAAIWTYADSFNVNVEEFYAVKPSLLRVIPCFYKYLAREGRRWVWRIPASSRMKG